MATLGVKVGDSSVKKADIRTHGNIGGAHGASGRRSGWAAASGEPLLRTRLEPAVGGYLRRESPAIGRSQAARLGKDAGW